MEHVGDDRARFWLRLRIGLIAAAFLIGFIAILGRVYYLQTVEAEKLEERSSVDRDREVTRQARRGDILDRHGVEMAVSVEVPSIYARPGMLGDTDRVAGRLADILDEPEEAIARRLDTESPFVWLKRQTHPSVAEQIEQLDLPGLGAMEEYERYYPMGELAGQLLGFVGIDGDGLEGVEREYDEHLAGETYNMQITRDALGRPMLLSSAPEFRQFEGHTVQLTVDEKIQRTAERALNHQIEQYDAAGGYAVAMDVETGDVLAMAKSPSFDPNRFGEFSSADWRLGPITDTFEPGSVFKPFLIAAALEEEAVELDDAFDLEGGRMRIGGHTIGDVTRRDEMTVAEILQKSSNIGSYKIAQRLGRQNYYDYLRAFGFGSPTGIDLRGEQSGVVWPPQQWAEITFANVAFGQGLSTTPLQLVTGVAALANGGMLLEPRIVDEIRDREGRVVSRREPTMVRRVIGEKAARQTAWAMSLVPLEAGTGTDGALEHFTVAAKTGTAQQVDPETRLYDPDHWISGYVGFAPAEKPEVAIAVFVDEAQDMRYGGRVAGPAFKEIAREALSQRGALPVADHEQFDLGEKPPVVDDVESGEGSRFDPPGDSLPRVRIHGDGVDRNFDDETVPDFTDLSLRAAVERARNRGLVPRVAGWGIVVSQSPPPGTPVEEASELRLTLQPHTESAMVSEQSTTQHVDN